MGREHTVKFLTLLCLFLAAPGFAEDGPQRQGSCLSATLHELTVGKGVVYNAAKGHYEVYKRPAPGSTSASGRRWESFTTDLYVPVNAFKSRGLSKSKPFDLGDSSIRYVGDLRPGAQQAILKVSFEPGDYRTKSTAIPFKAGSLVDPAIKRSLDLVFNKYEGMISPEGIAKMRAQEESLDPTRCIYAVIREPKTRDTKMVIRLYDTAPAEEIPSTLRAFGPSTDDQLRLPLEKSFPDLILPERLKNGSKAHLYELGRMAATDDIKGGVKPIWSQIAWYLAKKYQLKFPNDAVIYIAATKEGARAYQEKFGFHMAFTPEDGPSLRGNPDQYVLRMSVEEFVAKFHQLFDGPRPRSEREP